MRCRSWRSSCLFQHVLTEILGFVDDQHRLLALLDLAEQKFIEERERVEPIEAEPVDRQAELGRDRFHELVGIQRGIQNQRSGITAVELFEHRAAEGRFARADFAGELHKSFALANAVKQMIERLTVLRAVKQKPRVRRDVERRLRQAIIVKIHRLILSRKDAY